jgi:hypothetical protein
MSLYMLSNNKTGISSKENTNNFLKATANTSHHFPETFPFIATKNTSTPMPVQSRIFMQWVELHPS